MSKILDAVIETAHDLHEAGVMDELTMREFDTLKLPSVRHYKVKQIKRIHTLCI